jgi:IS4 transposase
MKSLSKWYFSATVIKRAAGLPSLKYRFTLSDKEISRIYGIRWDIEVFFKTTK